ncbi:hypothetical protein [Actinokineospora iranica]|uniref:Uncharacterized protein n=1 Tax=Actinokineospora iranica TaxID=1271860 RepID=A0A1G6XQ35_9PSEU|nr:hypothetical protein [Actinokineospora iranica]SDD79545.1 hypothetical protein SAMN05216174_11837 [Actinokineospora iranica]
MSEDPLLWPPPPVKVLIVTDDRGNFSDRAWGLNALIAALKTTPSVKVEVTTAHRQNTLESAEADHKNFRFDTHDLTQYDQIWLFGVYREKEPLSDKELRKLSEFMNDGGGVFATGDHENLGYAMCGKVPRVRSMRKWYYPKKDPTARTEQTDEPIAPPEFGPDRLDTLLSGSDDVFTLDDQSDDIPQTIYPTFYSVNDPTGKPYRWHTHPLLSGCRGTITVLPDHPHEGECYVPAKRDNKFTFDGHEVVEYPQSVAPVLVAHATVGVVPDPAKHFKGALNRQSFGVIGAYDGQLADVGRVVVDATWHHFFNINLIGDKENCDPVKRAGFLASEKGRQAYEDIKSYFRNIALWLAPPQVQLLMWWRTAWALRWHHQISMSLRPEYLADPNSLTFDEIRRVGHLARSARVEGIVVEWVGRLGIGALRPEIWDTLGSQVDPWLATAAESGGSALDPDLVIESALGAVVYGIAAEFPDPTAEAVARAETADWAEVLSPAVDRALALLSDHVQRTTEQLTGLGRTLSAG